MSAAPEPRSDRLVLDDPGVLIGALRGAGWRVIGPQARDGAVVYDTLTSAEALPRGLTDEQAGGHYRLRPGRPGRYFDVTVGPQSWKPWLFPPRRRLWSARATGDGFEVEPERDDFPPTAFFGVRACEIAAMGIQDRVFAEGAQADPVYTARRAATLIVAVQCARAADTCFCASMRTGPRADTGFDLALTELDGACAGLFVLEIGTDRGRQIVAGLGLAAATPAHLAAAAEAQAQAVRGQRRRMPEGIADALREAPDHPRWDVVAERCLSCANCTLACPTCFCSDVEDASDLTGDHAERWRLWDSCFTADFSYVHGGSVRRSTRSRYRQWMTHKLSSWHDQFGTSGCVGCGRCIAWCPVGIDITEEAAAIAATEGSP